MTTVTLSKIEYAPVITPKVQANNFWYLYWDVVAFGVAFGSTLSFLSVFLTRLGASGWQIGLFTAGPALVSTLLTLPAGQWLKSHSLKTVVIQTAFWHRVGFFVLIPLPLFFSDSLKIWVILILIVLMAIPGTALSIGFNALFAATVSPEWRGQVVGRRNALLAGATMITFMSSGWILDKFSFEWGYVIVFVIGALGGVVSTYQLSRIQVPEVPIFQMRPMGDRAQPGRAFGFSEHRPYRFTIGARLWLQWPTGKFNMLNDVSASYWWVMVAFFCFHFTQFILAPALPIFWVRELKLTDGLIGLLNAMFYLTMFVSAAFLEPLTKRFGNYHLTWGGAILLALYPLLNALGIHFGLMPLIIASLIGGVNWAILSGALTNRLLELIPDDSRPTHLAMYNLALNVAILASAMLASFLIDWLSGYQVMFIIFALRLCSGFILARWG